TRNGLRRMSTRGSNGHRAQGDHGARGNAHEWRSSVETEVTNLQSRNEELQSQINRLEKERQQFVSLLEAVPLGYVVMDENGTIKESNRQFETMLGLRKGIVAPIPLARMVVSADVPAF